MRVNELGREGRGRASVLILDPGDEFIETMRIHARRTGMKAAHFTALGAFRSATLAYFDWDTKEYREIPVGDQVEVTSLVGNVGVHDGEPVIHAHCVLGRPDGSAITGHLMEGHVRPTLEVVLTAYDDSLVRHTDEESGLPLIQ